MTPIAMMVKELLERGVPNDAILIAIEGSELALQEATERKIETIIDTLSAEFRGMSADTQAEERRRKDRERKRSKRGIPQNSAEFRRHPQNSAENALSLNSITKNLTVERERERKQNVRGHRLPDDWQPNLNDLELADQLLASRNRSMLELEKFRDHWKQQPGGRGVKLDWNAAWRNWARRAADYQPGGMNERRKTVHEAADDLLAKLREIEAPAPVCGSQSETVIRMLPARGRE